MTTVTPPPTNNHVRSVSRPTTRAMAPAASAQRCAPATDDGGDGAADQVTANICVAAEIALSSPPTTKRWSGSHQPSPTPAMPVTIASSVNPAATTSPRRVWACTCATRPSAPRPVGAFAGAVWSGTGRAIAALVTSMRQS